MKKILILSVLMFAARLPLGADEVQDLNRQVEQVDKELKKSGSPETALDVVAERTGVPQRRLQEQTRATKMGAGSLFIANTLSARTGRSFDEIVAEKNAGKGWGEIAKSHGVKLGPLVSEAKKLGRETAAKADKKNAEKSESEVRKAGGGRDARPDPVGATGTGGAGGGQGKGQGNRGGKGGKK